MSAKILTIRILIALSVFSALGFGAYRWLLIKDINQFYPQFRIKTEVGLMAVDGIIAPSAIQSLQEILKLKINLKLVENESLLKEELQKSDSTFDIIQLPEDLTDLNKLLVEIPLEKLRVLGGVSQDLKGPFFGDQPVLRVPILWGFYFVPKKLQGTKEVQFYGQRSHYEQIAKSGVQSVYKGIDYVADPKAKGLQIVKVNQADTPPNIEEISEAILFGVHFGIRKNSKSKELSMRVLNLLLDENIALMNAQYSGLGAIHQTAEFQGLKTYQRSSFLRQVSLLKIKRLVDLNKRTTELPK